MIIKYQLTPEDIIAMKKDSFKKIRFHQKRFNTPLIAVIFFVYWSGILLAPFLLEPTSLDIPFSGLFSILGAIGAILFVMLMMTVISKLYDFVTLSFYRFVLRNDKRLPRDVTLRFQETGINIHSTNGQSQKNTELAWESIEDISEDGKRLFLYFNEEEAIIIPKSEPILNEAEQGMLGDLLNRYLHPDVNNSSGEPPEFLN